jgi:DNA (cytosine-5)-methyltransferase 1
MVSVNSQTGSASNDRHAIGKSIIFQVINIYRFEIAKLAICDLRTLPFNEALVICFDEDGQAYMNSYISVSSHIQHDLGILLRKVRKYNLKQIVFFVPNSKKSLGITNLKYIKRKIIKYYKKPSAMLINNPQELKTRRKRFLVGILQYLYKHFKYISGRLISLFSGAGGFDLGFENVGFNVLWANEYDKDIWKTYRQNHPRTYLSQRSILDVDSTEIPSCDGLIGGPPCQSWSSAGSRRGIDDPRGKLFFEYIRVIRDKKPKFFVAENVKGILNKKNVEAFENIKQQLRDTGYRIYCKLLNSYHYEVPQDRNRVIIVGIRKDLDISFEFPKPIEKKVNLRDAIFDLHEEFSAVESKTIEKKNNLSNKENCNFPNHEYFVGTYSSHFMSRNRVRDWDRGGFTVLAGGRHTPLHPQAPPMIKIGKDKMKFKSGAEHLYRRLTVRECARIQTFPDDYLFVYDDIDAGYKMVGNAVPVKFTEHIAKEIRRTLEQIGIGA